jgi:hypothetical protein
VLANQKGQVLLLLVLLLLVCQWLERQGLRLLGGCLAAE